MKAKTPGARDGSAVTPATAAQTAGAAPLLRALAWIPGLLAHLSTTRVNSWTGLVADVLVALALLGAGLWRHDIDPAAALLALASGLFLFSFIEYAFHRWLFHGSVRITEQGHRKHHEQPLGYDSLPFFFSPLLLTGLTGLLCFAVPTTFALLFTGALAAGYATYGWSHVIIHHRRFRHALLRRWAAIHHIHHHHADSNFGVTSPLWDILLGTRHLSGNRARTP